jgi:hypothetical protein
MKNFRFVFMMTGFIGITLTALGQQNFYSINAGEGNGIQFWQSDWYKIHMGNSPEYHYGPVTDYSIKSNMNTQSGRGWTWGIMGATPVAAISNSGVMQIAGAFNAGGGINVGLDGPSAMGYGSLLQLTGPYSNTDPLWLSRYNSSENNSELRVNIGDDNGGDDAFVVGNTYYQDGQWKSLFRVLNNGRVGIGTDAPAQKLNVYDAGNSTQILIGNPNSASGGFTSLGMGTSANIGGYGWLQAVKSAGSLYGDIVINQNGGNVGIGTASPTARLSVSTVNPDGWSGNVDAFKLISPDNAYYLDVLPYIVQNGNVGYHFSPNGNTGMTITTTGNVGVGTTNPDQKLTVNGTIHTKEVKVDLSVPGPDYVFEKDYDLLSLAELENYINQNKHLPEVPSAKEMEKDGLNLKEMNLILLKKVEELTLHLIEQKKVNDDQQVIIKKINATITEQQKQIIQMQVAKKRSLKKISGISK